MALLLNKVHEGTASPAGIVVASDSAAPDAAKSEQVVSADGASSVAAVGGKNDTAPAEVNEEEAKASWEAYVEQYREWYEAYGKAAGADPNLPSTIDDDCCNRDYIISVVRGKESKLTS
jgi:hypothetical protein